MDAFEKGNLQNQYLVYPAGKCESVVEAAWKVAAGEIRIPLKVSGELEKNIFEIYINKFHN